MLLKFRLCVKKCFIFVLVFFKYLVYVFINLYFWCGFECLVCFDVLGVMCCLCVGGYLINLIKIMMGWGFERMYREKVDLFILGFFFFRFFVLGFFYL